ncbi:expressed unknown protein [Seminavis robusta]|uniref:Uncharacterized protein n=1 Tax=Seminavis robusta TaxID=568900 RepID=A0A9N8ELK5_9STRA|nr:expressed unknown protein [Seminavis robusta]|eukprot:Sro1131_g244700.1 n/a (286) ;mRNA; f:32489-33346
MTEEKPTETAPAKEDAKEEPKQEEAAKDTPAATEESKEEPPVPEKERDNLEDAVRVRDEMVIALEKVRQEKQRELEQLQKEFEEERLIQMKEQLVHKIESDRLKKQTKAVTERLETLEKDMRDKQAIHEYATLIKGVAPQGGVDSQYLIKLQNQLAKAVKKMEGTTAKMTQIENSCDQVVNSLRSEIADIVEDRCRTELELRKQLEVLKEKTRELQAEYDERIKENQKTLESLKTKAEAVVPLEELEAEMDETYSRLYELKRIHETQATTLEQLDTNLKARRQPI